MASILIMFCVVEVSLVVVACTLILRTPEGRLHLPAQSGEFPGWVGAMLPFLLCHLSYLVCSHSCS